MEVPWARSQSRISQEAQEPVLDAASIHEGQVHIHRGYIFTLYLAIYVARLQSIRGMVISVMYVMCQSLWQACCVNILARLRVQSVNGLEPRGKAIVKKLSLKSSLPTMQQDSGIWS